MSDKLQVHHFVLIHGACHGAWCWYKTKALLEKAGHRVTAIDLAGAGEHPADAKTIKSFEEYNAPSEEFLSSLPDGEKVILVGHSLGGLSCARNSELFPEKISAAVYLTAAILPNGYSIHDLRAKMSNISRILDDSFEIISDENGPVSMLFTDAGSRTCYTACSPEDIAFAQERLRPLAIGVLDSKFTLTADGFEKVPRVYIVTENDVIQPVEVVELILELVPVNEVVRMEADHSPFFSATEVLHKHFLYIADKYD